MANPKTIAAPRPEVLHLPTLMRRVESGEIRVPDFQRKFVWKEKQIIELLESVYKGYPIGSLLFWRAESSQLRYDAKRSYPLPTVDKARDPVSFLLDGQQRLTSLYGCLYLSETKRKSADVFNVVFDLRDKTFLHWVEELEESGKIRLSALFSPAAFLAAQRDLQKEADGNRLLDESIKLHAVFQEYMVPTVTIEKRRVNEVVEIFERVNRTGTKLSSVDFMRAVTWSSGFDLGREVSRTHRKIKQLGFDLQPETIVKIISIALGTAPLPDAMLDLRLRPAATLKAGVKRARLALRRAIRFLQNDLQVYSDVYVPYEGQLLVLSRFFLDNDYNSLPDHVRKNATRWFIATSLNEHLRGKPDHVVSGLVDQATAIIEGKSKVSLPSTLRISEPDLLKRKVIKGKAMAGGVANVLALSSPRSVFTGKHVDVTEFMGDFNSDRFSPILSLEEVRSAINTDLDSSKILANVIVASARDVGRLGSKSIRDALMQLESRDKKLLQDVLKSQVISEKAFKALKDENLAVFLRQRAKDIISRAKELCSG